MMYAFEAITVLFLAYVVLNEVLYVRGVRQKTGFLEDFDDFLSHVRHYYYYTGSCEDAVFYSIPKCKRRIMPVLSQIAACLESGAEEGTITSSTSDMNKFTRLFVSLALLVSENGDSSTEGGSVFLESVMQLRSDIQDERRFLENRKHRFTGLGLTAALPIAAVPFVAAWGSNTIPSLLSFYYGRTGNVILCVIFIVTVLCYRGVCNLRTDGHPGEIYERFISKMELPERVLTATAKVNRFLEGRYRKMAVLFAVSVLIMIPILSGGHAKGVKLLKENVSDIDNISNTADGRQMKAMERVIPQYVALYTEDRSGIAPEREELTDILLNEEGIRTEAVAADTAEEIIRRVNAIKQERFGICDCLLVILAGVIAAFMPQFLEICSSVLSDSRRQDEVMQFQSLIHMQKRVPGISTVDILESMETFANFFKPGLQQCINEFCVNDIEALQTLAANETHPDFLRLTDCFLSVDEAGVEDAFDEVTEEIVNFKENRRLSRSIMLDSNALLGSLISVIPGGLILFGYLLVPFMVRSIGMFNTYQENLGEYLGGN